jgi:hypothetical protein
MRGSFRVLAVEDDPEVTEYLRLVLLRTDGENGSAANIAASGHPRRQHLTGVGAILHGAAGRGGHPAAGTACTDGTHSPTALIVNDDPEQLAALTAYFHHAGCAVIGVADAERALALAPDVQPDVIVFDPGTHGQEQTARLGLRYPHCFIVVTTVLDVHHQTDDDLGGSSPTGHPAAASLP